MIGQEKLKLFIKNLLSKGEVPVEINLLLTGKAGIGKSHALRYIYNTLSRESELKDCIEHHPHFATLEMIKKWDSISIHIVDEIHKAENFEQFYDFMESHLFLTATNLPEDLPEAFRSRCINLVMENYTKKELGQIVEAKYGFNIITVANLVKRSRGTPRDILQMASLININPNSDLESLGYFKDGFRGEDYLYINYLKKVGDSSLGRISAGTNLDSTRIQEFVEPFLLERGIVSITNRRKLNETKI